MCIPGYKFSQLSLFSLVILNLGVLGQVQDRCTVRQFSQVEAAKGSCKDITISNLVVPGGRTLDLQKLKTGTRVKFSGTTVSDRRDAWEQTNKTRHFNLLRTISI
jgi:hypothetical protein